MHPQVDGTYVACMEDVLDLYAEAPDPKRPVVCFDESPIQLIGEVRQPIPATPGQLERYDCEYRRNGTANLFVFLDAHQPWRKVKVTDQRTARDFAECMRDLVDLHYPKAGQIRIVLDNLSTHSPGALYEAFPAPEAHRILREDVVLSEAMTNSEVERYTFRTPAQATSYFYGFTRLLELRADTEKILGAKFNQQAYHDFILSQGLLPPALLRKAVMEEFVKTGKLI